MRTFRIFDLYFIRHLPIRIGESLIGDDFGEHLLTFNRISTVPRKTCLQLPFT